MSRRALLRAGVALLTLGVLALVACIVCVLLAIWTSDGRWSDTAFLAFVVGIAGTPIGAFCWADGRSS